MFMIWHLFYKTRLRTRDRPNLVHARSIAAASKPGQSTTLSVARGDAPVGLTSWGATGTVISTSAAQTGMTAKSIAIGCVIATNDRAETALECFDLPAAVDAQSR